MVPNVSSFDLAPRKLIWINVCSSLWCILTHIPCCMLWTRQSNSWLLLFYQIFALIKFGILLLRHGVKSILGLRIIFFLAKGQHLSALYLTWQTLFVEVSHTGVKSHNPLGFYNHLHQQLQNIFQEIGITYPRVPEKFHLDMSVKAMNDILGSKTLVPFDLVSEENTQTCATDYTNLSVLT